MPTWSETTSCSVSFTQKHEVKAGVLAEQRPNLPPWGLTSCLGTRGDMGRRQAHCPQ